MPTHAVGVKSRVTLVHDRRPSCRPPFGLPFQNRRLMKPAWALH